MVGKVLQKTLWRKLGDLECFLQQLKNACLLDRVPYSESGCSHVSRDIMTKHQSTLTCV